MINIYISDNKIQYLSGTGGSRVKVKELYFTVVDGKLSDIALKFLGKANCAKKVTVNFIVDSPRVMIKEESLPCVTERDLRKIIEIKGVQSGKPVDNTVDEVMAVIREHENKRIDTVSKTTVAPTTIVKNIEDIVKAFEIKINAIVTAQECMDYFMKSFAKKYYPGIVLLVNYKDYFATIAAYKDGEEIFAENIFMQSDDDSLAYKRLVDLSHRGIIKAMEHFKQYIEHVYIVGDVRDIDNMLEPMTLEVGIDCMQLPLPDEIKGVSPAEFNEFFAAISSIMLTK